jgi:hypothetical protein
MDDEVILFEGFCDTFLIFVGGVSFKCLEIVVVEEVMDFGRIVFSVYDDTYFTFIGLIIIAFTFTNLPFMFFLNCMSVVLL